MKPDNLFVCRMGDEPDFLKVLDFGIAKIEGAEEDATVTRAGWVHGTPAYMSPEVCNGARADARSDVYSLGAVLYFLLTGTPPFTAATAARPSWWRTSSDVPDTPSARTPVPADVERVVLQRPREGARERDSRALAGLDAALAACKDAVGWTSDQAHAFWTTLRPEAALRGRAAPRRRRRRSHDGEAVGPPGMKAG